MTRVPHKWKNDSRPKRHGWAPGDYLNKCRSGGGCGDEFIGDKRATECADCAYAKPEPETASYQRHRGLKWRRPLGFGDLVMAEPSAMRECAVVTIYTERVPLGQIVMTRDEFEKLVLDFQVVLKDISPPPPRRRRKRRAYDKYKTAEHKLKSA